MQDTNLLEQLIISSHLSINHFIQQVQQLQTQILQQTQLQKTWLYSTIQSLIIDQKFEDIFSISYLSRENNKSNNYRHNQILQFGYQVIEYLFSRKQLFKKDNFVLSNLLKKCNIDMYLLIAICKGYLINSIIKRDKVKSFFIQNFKRGNHKCMGMDRFHYFHQSLVEKSSISNTFLCDEFRKLKSYCQFNYFLSFIKENSDFFPPTIQIQNFLYKMLMCIKLDNPTDLTLFDKAQQYYFLNNQYHLMTTSKNFRFVIQFFRNIFNQKTSQYYPQKSFLRILSHYSQEQINKIVSFAEIGLSWTQQQVFTCLGNLIKLGLTQVNFSLWKSFIMLWMKIGLNDFVLKVIQTYIPKIFIFLKHEKLFDISLAYLKYMSFGPKISTRGIMNKLLEKLLIFCQKQCPFSKKYQLFQFMSLVESKYEKIATLQDKLYINLKKQIKLYSQNNKFQLFKQEDISNKLRFIQWQQIKVPLFGKNNTSKTSNASSMNPKQAGQYRGLYNIGNSCYMNSFIQCLFMNIQFRKNILSQSTLSLEKNLLQKIHQNEAKQINKANSNKEKQNHTLMTRELVRPIAQIQRLFAQLMKSKRCSISPITIKNISSVEFKNTFQQDSIQFGRSLLDIISRSSFQNLFQGQQTNEIICPNCLKSRYKKQNFIDLMLNQGQQHKATEQQLRQGNASSLSISQGINLQKMIYKHFQSEQIDNLQCDYCLVRSDKSLKKHFISKVPNYLILTLKRFEYDLKQNKNVKKHYQVDLRQGMISLDGEIYALYGIIIHRGQNANSGHYFSFCREWTFQPFGDLQTILQSKNKMIQQKQQSQNNQNETEFQMMRSQNIQIKEKDQTIKYENQKIQIQNSGQNIPQNMKQSINQSTKPLKQSQPPSTRWICFNDSVVSTFQSFRNVKQFLQLNREDTPYILFYQKVSHISSKQKQYLKQQIKLRQPLQRFIQKDNSEYIRFIQTKKRQNQNITKVDWKNFGKIKGFTAFDYFKFTKKDDDQDQHNGFGGGGGGGFGNNPII